MFLFRHGRQCLCPSEGHKHTKLDLIVGEIVYSTNKKAEAVYYTVIKYDGHLRTRGKCRKHEPQASNFYISQVFSNVRRVLSSSRKTNKTITHAFSMFYTDGFLTIRARAGSYLYYKLQSSFPRFFNLFIEWIRFLVLITWLVKIENSPFSCDVVIFQN